MKDFLLLSNINAATYKDFFPLIKDNKVRLGYSRLSGGMDMYAGEGFDPGKKKVKYDENGNMIVNIEGVVWFSTLPTPNKRKLVLTKKYNPNDYPHYDNYNAINVDKVRDIPYDYDCVMGVPISILEYDLSNFVIVREKTINGKDTKIDGKEKYRRVLIRRKQL